ncbi:uncharacterized protein A4U43_C09F8050 [Asparagus officinalis]|uniref:Uncharacterized protein n=1 Tax=Asparagus officinalis TaxID=4686 RepID=A0A5P1E630_ASPOF|nr:uncharacterized protein A4U43_C09F8050 [Asparagus officinalis]
MARASEAMAGARAGLRRRRFELTGGGRSLVWVVRPEANGGASALWSSVLAAKVVEREGVWRELKGRAGECSLRRGGRLESQWHWDRRAPGHGGRPKERESKVETEEEEEVKGCGDVGGIYKALATEMEMSTLELEVVRGGAWTVGRRWKLEVVVAGTGGCRRSTLEIIAGAWRLSSLELEVSRH